MPLHICEVKEIMKLIIEKTDDATGSENELFSPDDVDDDGEDCTNDWVEAVNVNENRCPNLGDKNGMDPNINNAPQPGKTHHELQ